MPASGRSSERFAAALLGASTGRRRKPCRVGCFGLFLNAYCRLLTPMSTYRRGGILYANRRKEVAMLRNRGDSIADFGLSSSRRPPSWWRTFSVRARWLASSSSLRSCWSQPRRRSARRTPSSGFRPGRADYIASATACAPVTLSPLSKASFSPRRGGRSSSDGTWRRTLRRWAS
jgi:hypothetical protein